jgi:hypothetical protein
LEPQRPFVPHHTPTKAQPAVAAADFFLARPFVPGREIVQAQPVFASTSATSPEAGGMPSIEQFLDLSAPTVRPGLDDTEENWSDDDDERELPPVEHFVDPLPLVDDFAADAATGGADAQADAYPAAPAPEPIDGWVETDWQQYDWRSAAALGETENAREASNAWADTDWDAGIAKHRERPHSPADDIATALDQIAQRIREGELPMPVPGALSDPATIAATVAALFGIRR